ncbi:MAG: hypothetical protein NXI20_20415 [bacterium]|nr:hypothetical protein [bacterium]
MKKLHLSLIFLCFSSFLFGQTLYVPSGTGGIQPSTNNSNIGIGTPDASSLLTLRTSGSSTDLEFKNAGTSRTWKHIMESSGKLRIWGSAAGYVTTVDPVSGNFGIGADVPSERLHISGSGLVKSLVESSDNHAYYVVEGAAGKGAFVDYYRKGDGRVWHTGLRNGNNNFEFRLGDQTNVFTLKDNGNVGIGTNSPNFNLDIVGTGTSTTISRVNSGGHANYRQSRGSSSYDGGYLFYTGTTLDWRFQESANGSDLHIRDESLGVNVLTIIDNTGNVGIGTSSTGPHKLAVDGSIGSREIKVETATWHDYVFDEDYELPTLEQVEKHISEKGHLSNIPSEAEVLENGIYLGEMNGKLLQKIEELTLYMIEMNKQVKSQTERIEQLEKENAALKEKVSGL